jgi:hypothetical protein
MMKATIVTTAHQHHTLDKALRVYGWDISLFPAKYSREREDAWIAARCVCKGAFSICCSERIRTPDARNVMFAYVTRQGWASSHVRTPYVDTYGRHHEMVMVIALQRAQPSRPDPHCSRPASHHAAAIVGDLGSCDACVEFRTRAAECKRLRKAEALCRPARSGGRVESSVAGSAWPAEGDAANHVVCHFLLRFFPCLFFAFTGQPGPGEWAQNPSRVASA